jgi:hypothetical protein
VFIFYAKNKLGYRDRIEQSIDAEVKTVKTMADYYREMLKKD